MRRDTFKGTSVDPSQIFEKAKSELRNENFEILSEDARPGLWDIHAKNSGVERIVPGEIRDVDIVIAGNQDNFEVQLHAGVWGRDLMVPAIEGAATLGAAAAVDYVSVHEFEKRLWEKLVHEVDPGFKICPQDGLTFKSQADLDEHLNDHRTLREMRRAQLLSELQGAVTGAGI